MYKDQFASLSFFQIMRISQIITKSNPSRERLLFKLPRSANVVGTFITRATIDLEQKIRTLEENLNSLPKKQNNCFCLHD